MGILDWLFGPWKRGSSGLFNQANQHWQVMRQAVLSGSDRLAQGELLEVVRLCQESIQANPQKEGDAYVLLTNSLLRGSDVYDAADEELLLRYAAASIYSWWYLPHKEPPITRHYDFGLRWYQEVLEKLGRSGSADSEATMAEYGALYGTLITSPSGFENIKAALENLWRPGRDKPEVIAEILYSHWNNALHGDGSAGRADFRSIDLSGEDLSKAKLVEMYRNGLGDGRIQPKVVPPEISRILVGELIGANFAGANLSGANFSETSLSNADFTGANLSGANLKKADLKMAEFGDTDLTGADLAEANLKAADLKTAAGLTQDQIKSAILDEFTHLPDYLQAPSDVDA